MRKQFKVYYSSPSNDEDKGFVKLVDSHDDVIYQGICSEKHVKVIGEKLLGEFYGIRKYKCKTKLYRFCQWMTFITFIPVIIGMVFNGLTSPVFFFFSLLMFYWASKRLENQ